MVRRMTLAALLSAVCLSFQASDAMARDHYYYAPPAYYAAPYYGPPVFYGPPTVVVQRPVVVAQPVVVPEPVYVEVPTVYAQPAYVQPAPVTYSAYPTSYHYSSHVFPFGPHAKEEYRVYTPYGVHKYKYKYNWLTGYHFEYDFDD